MCIEMKCDKKTEHHQKPEIMKHWKPITLTSVYAVLSKEELAFI